MTSKTVGDAAVPGPGPRWQDQRKAGPLVRGQIAEFAWIGEEEQGSPSAILFGGRRFW
jgi:hypothetical protein